MAQIRFNVKPISDKKMQIRAIFQDGSSQTSKYTGETIPANKVNEKYKYWDSQKQQVRNLEASTSSRINSLLDKWRSLFASYKDDCKRAGERVDIPLFIQSLAGTSILKHDKTNTLYSISQSFLVSIKKTRNNTTYKGYKVLSEQIKKYQDKRKKPVLLSDVNKAFYKDFTLYLISDENNTNASIGRKQGKIMTMITYAIEDLKIKLPDSDYKKRYALKEAKSAKFPLRPEEVATLRAYSPDNAYHAIVLDAFLLACETGLRHSDIIQLQPAHINSQVTDSGIIRFISLTNIKTDNKNNMPLSDHACAVIDKYTIEGSEAPLFKFHHSQAAGKVLKTIFEHLKLNRPCEIITIQGAKTVRANKPLHDIISFHMARNTYITRLLSSNLAPAFVKDNAGHSKIDITMSYYRNDDITRWQETLKILNN